MCQNCKVCKNCESYRKPKCLETGEYTARKNTCDKFVAKR